MLPDGGERAATVVQADRERQVRNRRVTRSARAFDRSAANCSDGFIVEIENTPRIGEQHGAGARQNDLTALLTEKGFAQLPKLLANRRPRATDVISRAVETAKLLRYLYANRNIECLGDETKRFIDLGFPRAKIKIGAGRLSCME